MELLLRSEIPLEGAEVCVVGYGDLVGAPLSVMLTQDSIRGNATVTSTHIKTSDLAAHTRRADILVAAAGVPELIRGDMIKPGATVIDVGVHRTPDGLVGDVVFDEAVEVAGAITPVPGGVGPMTVAMLLVNTVAAAEAQAYAVTSPSRRPARRAARRRRFVVTGEIVPPRAGAGATVTEHARGLVGYVDAVNVTDNPAACAHMSPLAGARFVHEAGIEPTVQLTCRDRNRLGDHGRPARRLGARRPEPLLSLGGDPLAVGDHPDAETGADLASERVVALARRIRDEGRPAPAPRSRIRRGT